MEIERLYGTANIEEALQILKVSEARISKQANIFDQIKQMSKDLKKINSNPRWIEFKKDAAHDFKVTIASIEEALAGIACEEQKLLTNLTRSIHKAEEFIEDFTKIQWDVKSPPSYAKNGKYIFHLDEAFNSIQAGYIGTENVILNITNLTIEDINKIFVLMKNRLSCNEWERTTVVHIIKPQSSMNTKQFIKFMEQFKCL